MKNWNLWKKLLVENNVGNPVNYFLYKKSSGNRIRQVYHLKKFVDFANLDLKKTFTPQKIKIAINHYLAGEDIVIIDTAIVDESFHSRFSAKQRSYQYRIINRQAPLILEKNRAWHIPQDLNLDKMIDASKLGKKIKDTNTKKTKNTTTNNNFNYIYLIQKFDVNNNEYIYKREVRIL